MLPKPLQFVIAMIASAITDRMERRLTYLDAEVAVLRQLLESRHRDGAIAIHARAARSAGGGGEGVDTRGAESVLPHRLAGDDLGVVPGACRA
jgi:hypothetical protein